ncbi:MAG: hydrogenase maturation protease [Pseudolabrys sp.]
MRVIGIGSPFGADCIGWQVAEALQDRLDERAGPDPDALDVQVVIADRPGVDLLRLMQGVRWAVLVDAVVARDEAPTGDVGTIARSPRWLRRDELQALSLGHSSHAVGVSEALALGEVLGQLPERLSILGIGVEPDADAPVYAGAVEEAVAMILAALSAPRVEGHPEPAVTT